jgi:hypothetical protein
MKPGRPKKPGKTAAPGQLRSRRRVALEQAGAVTAPPFVRTQFGVLLTASEKTFYAPKSEIDSPPWDLANRFWEILSARFHEIPGLDKTGVIAFDLEASYLDADPGSIPLQESGPLIDSLREKLPRIVAAESPEPQLVYELSHPERGAARLLIKFYSNVDIKTDDNVYNLINNFNLFYRKDDVGAMSEELPGGMDEGHEQGSEVPSLDENIKALVTLPPDDYGGRVVAAASLNAASRSLIAEQLAPALNAHIHSMMHGTLEQKKELARWVNDQLEPLGLAVQCPNTKLPAKLRGIAGSYRPDVSGGTFCFEVYKDGKQKKTAYSDTLPELTLTDATPSQEPEKHWQQAVGLKVSRGGRLRT